MDKLNTAYTGERLSFFKLFSQKKFKLIVPIIQRDYAQGRISEETTEVRNEFVEALFSYLEEGRPNRDLDFVYGTLRRTQSANGDTTTCFIPLDGQQRLTTLFLLHWYLVQISNDENLKLKFYQNLLNNGQSMFAYETRQSSSDFCDGLIQSQIDFSNLKTIKNKKDEEIESLSETIKNQRWFYRNWINDPTIMSMLVMLDTLHEKFAGKNEFLPLLMDEENPVITFVFLDLDEYRLTDDLYIKMNSRGLPLTKFENLKAKLEQHLDSFDQESEPLKSRKFILKLSSIDTEVTLKKYFAHNIDTKWTTLFWYYAKDTENPRKIDAYIENFIRIVITNEYARSVSLGNRHNSDETLDMLYDSKNKSISFSKYEQSEALTVNAMLAVIDALDSLYNGANGIKQYLREDYRFYFDEDKMFKKVINNDLSRPERMQFYAYIQYLIKYKDRIDNINDWMRVIHNLTHPDNTITDSNYDLSNGLKEIDRLLEFAPDILSYLRTYPTISRFARHQVIEEVIKALLISDESWRSEIESTEKHNYFVGQIGFILSFAGIVRVFIENKDSVVSNGSFNWDENQNNEILSVFKNYARIAKFIFHIENGNRINDIDFCFERAVLTQGDYLLQWGESEWWNLLSTETVKKNVKRDYSWRRLLRIIESPKEDDKELTDKQSFVKAVFDYIGNSRNIVSSLKELCDQYQSELSWNYCLIKTPQLINYSSKGWMHFANSESQILILKEWYLNMYHVELFTYYLWINKFKESYMNGIIVGKYDPQKRSDVLPTIRFESFSYKHRKYVIEISAIVKENNFKNYRIAFHDNNTDRFEYPDEILSVLEHLSFKPSSNESNNSFVWKSKSPSNTYKITDELCNLLNELKAK